VTSRDWLVPWSVSYWILPGLHCKLVLTELLPSTFSAHPKDCCMQTTSQPSPTRREAIKTASLASLATAIAPLWLGPSLRAAGFRSPNERPVLGCIGTGDRWNSVGPAAMNFSDCAAVCDVDANNAAKGRETALKRQSRPGAERTVEVHEDYRKILGRPDIDVVTIVTPDHWHSRRARMCTAKNRSP